MREKSYYRQGLEHYILKGKHKQYTQEQLDILTNDELYETYQKYLKDNGIDEEGAERYLKWWFFTNR